MTRARWYHNSARQRLVTSRNKGPVTDRYTRAGRIHTLSAIVPIFFFVSTQTFIKGHFIARILTSTVLSSPATSCHNKVMNIVYGNTRWRLNTWPGMQQDLRMIHDGMIVCAYTGFWYSTSGFKRKYEGKQKMKNVEDVHHDKLFHDSIVAIGSRRRSIKTLLLIFRRRRMVPGAVMLLRHYPVSPTSLPPCLQK